jgi:RNA polymerase sigma factor (sigma-70 family)
MASSIKLNNELFPLVVAGDPEARETLIKENRPLVVVKADGLIKRIPGVEYLRNDLISAGYVGLVEVVNKLPGSKSRCGAFNKLAGKAITRRMSDLLDIEKTIRVPRSSWSAAKNKKRPINPPEVSNALPETLEAVPQSTADLRDVVDFGCHTDDERTCLRMREAKYTFEEIAETLSIKPSQAQRMFAKVKHRVLHHWNHPGGMDAVTMKRKAREHVEKEFLRLRAEGHTLKQTAALLGMTFSAVKHLCRRLQKPNPQ